MVKFMGHPRWRQWLTMVDPRAGPREHGVDDHGWPPGLLRSSSWGQQMCCNRWPTHLMRFWTKIPPKKSSFPIQLCRTLQPKTPSNYFSCHGLRPLLKEPDATIRNAYVVPSLTITQLWNLRGRRSHLGSQHECITMYNPCISMSNHVYSHITYPHHQEFSPKVTLRPLAKTRWYSPPTRPARAPHWTHPATSGWPSWPGRRMKEVVKNHGF